MKVEWSAVSRLLVLSVLTSNLILINSKCLCLARIQIQEFQISSLPDNSQLINGQVASSKSLQEQYQKHLAHYYDKRENSSNLKQRRYARKPNNISSILPEFSAPIGNVTAVLGRDVRLTCQVENLGQYQVAWLKEETKTILSIDTNVIITNYRIFLIPDDQQRKWVLHIKDVQESDRGSYQCQVNTSPMRSSSGFLEVVVPPSINEAHTTNVAEAAERTNVSLECRASGHPKPLVVWRRDDGTPIKLQGNHHKSTSNSLVSSTGTRAPITELADIRSERLLLINVDRSMAGTYVCTMSNGIPIPAVKRIPLYVKYEPQVSIRINSISSINQGDHSLIGGPLQVDCLVDAYPKPNMYWTKRSLPPMSLNSRSMGPFGSSWQNRQHQSSSGATSRYSSHTLRAKLGNHERQETEDKLVPFQVSNMSQQRLINGQLIGEEMEAQPIVTPSATKSPISVKHSVLNDGTYKLSMSINRLKSSDYGEYTCIAVNAMGQSDASILIDDSFYSKPSSPSSTYKPSSVEHEYEPKMASNTLDDIEQSSGGNEAKQNIYSPNNGPRRPSNQRVYDEKYLEEIKARQNSNYLMGSQNTALKSQQSRMINSRGTNNHGSRVWDKFSFIIVTIILLSMIYSMQLNLSQILM